MRSSGGEGWKLMEAGHGQETEENRCSSVGNAGERFHSRVLGKA